jgi:hypothetical protein
MSARASSNLHNRDAITVRIVADQVCPLCFGHYISAVEATCVACDSWSCPMCVEEIAGSNGCVCLACGGLEAHEARMHDSVETH